MKILRVAYSQSAFFSVVNHQNLGSRDKNVISVTAKCAELMIPSIWSGVNRIFMIDEHCDRRNVAVSPN